MGRKNASKKRRQRERKEAARSGLSVEQLRAVKAGGTGKGKTRNQQAPGIPGFGLHQQFRQEIEE